jgi:uncharacterized coiled-coil protein SlyX
MKTLAMFALAVGAVILAQQPASREKGETVNRPQPALDASDDDALSEMDEQSAEQDEQIAELDEEMAEQDQEMAEQDQEMAEQDQEMAERDQEAAGRDREAFDCENPVAEPDATENQ